jgi:iron complex transport system substrate-binding protein
MIFIGGKALKNKLYFVITLIILTLFSACENSDDHGKSPKKEKNGIFPVVVEDSTNTEVIIKEKPVRIISLIPSNTEIAFALGLGEEIVGVTSNDSYPEEVKNKEVIGGFQLDFEKIISLNPDLVLAHGLNGDLEKLRNAGLTIVVVNNNESSFEDVYASIQLVAKATGKEKNGQQLIHSMIDRLDVIKKKAKEIQNQKSIWVEIDPMLYSTGQGTFMQEMLNILNARNIVANQQGWPQVSEEFVVSKNPDIIIATYEGAITSVNKRDAWKNITALKTGNVFEINADLVSRAGPRVIEGVEKLAEIIYPKLYKK